MNVLIISLRVSPLCCLVEQVECVAVSELTSHNGFYLFVGVISDSISTGIFNDEFQQFIFIDFNLRVIIILVQKSLLFVELVNQIYNVRMNLETILCSRQSGK